jgi:hypothetical protein
MLTRAIECRTSAPAGAALAPASRARAGVLGRGARPAVARAHAADDEASPSCAPSRRDTIAAGLVLLAAAAHPAGPAAAAASVMRPLGGSGDWSSPGLAAPVDEEAPKFFKTPGGVPVQELAAGEGPTARPGQRVLVDYVLRRANGYFIYATVEGVSFQPRDVPTGPVLLTLGDGSVVPGLDEVLLTMRRGGKRRVLLPPAQGYPGRAAAIQPKMPTFATQRQLDTHSVEPLMFELQVLRVLD